MAVLPCDLVTRTLRGASRVAITHFGAYGDVEQHLLALREELTRVEELAGTHGESAFAAAIRARIAAGTSTGTAAAYAQATSPEQNFAGLARYLSARPSAG